MTPSDSKKLMSLGDGFLRTLRDQRKPTIRLPWWVPPLALFILALLGVAQKMVLAHTAEHARQEPTVDSAALFRARDLVPNTVEKVEGGTCRFGQDAFVAWMSDGTSLVVALDRDKPAMTCRPTNRRTNLDIAGMPTTFYIQGMIADFEEGTDL